MQNNSIVLLDFYGIITTDESLIKFIRYAVGDLKTAWGMILLSPMLIIYKLKFIPNYKAKQYMLSYFFKDMSEEKLMQVANEYFLKHINTPSCDQKPWKRLHDYNVVSLPN